MTYGRGLDSYIERGHAMTNDKHIAGGKGLMWALSCGTAVAALLTAGAVSAQVVTVAQVNGTIYDTDGTRLLYAPSGQAGEVDIQDLSSQADTPVSLGSGYNTQSGSLTPSGAIFTVDQGLSYLKSVYNYNGALTEVAGQLQTDLFLAGNYAAFETWNLPGYADGNYRLDTTTGAMVALPTGNYYLNDVVADGRTVFAQTSTGYGIVAYDGSTLSDVTTTNLPLGDRGALTDGQIYVFQRYPQIACAGCTSSLILRDGTTETTLAPLISIYRDTPGYDYQVNNGWVVYHDNLGNTFERSPSGTVSSAGPSTSIVTLSSDGDFTYIFDGVLYLKTVAGTAITIGSQYTGSVKVGGQWYFYGGGVLATLAPAATPIDAAFNAGTGPFTTGDGTVLYGVGDITTPRVIILDGATMLDTQGYRIGLAGQIRGSGQLSVEGTGGTAVVTADDIYSGGTRILAGGRLQLGDGGTTGSITGDVVDNGTLLFDRSDTHVFGGAISGTGSVAQAGGGTTVLTGANTYSGGTAISAGTLQVGDGGTTGSITGDVLDNGVLVFKRSDTTVFAGAISGAGAVVQAGSGTTVLTGANTYSGGTLIAAGTLQVGEDGTTGAITGPVVDNGTLVFKRSDTVVDTNVMTGSGGLIQAGSGRLVLDGHYAYTGQTSVTAGTLQVGDATHDTQLAAGVTVGAAGRLEGQGTILGAVINTAGGTVAPTALTVGSYVQGSGSAFDVSIAQASASTLRVAGQATLDGTLNIAVSSGVQGAHSYRLVSASSISGRFADVRGAGALTGEMYGTVYSPTAVDLVIQPLTSGQVYSDLASGDIDAAETVGDLVSGHAADGGHGVSVWLQATGGTGAYRGTAAASGFDTRSDGVIGGLDLAVAPGITAGLGLIYNRSTLSLDATGDRATGDTSGLWLSTGVVLPAGHAELSGAWLVNNGHVSRSVLSDTGPVAEARSRAGSTAFTATAQYSLPIASSDLSAVGRLNYTQLKTKSAGESGAGMFDFDIRGHTYSSTYAQAGLRWRHAYAAHGGDLVPEVSLGLRSQLGSLAAPVAIALQGADGPDFTVSGVARQRTAAIVGLGLTSLRTDTLSLHIRIDGRLARGQSVGVASVGARLRF